MHETSDSKWRIVEQVLEHPESRREAMLGELCGSKAELIEEIRVLMRLVEANQDLFNASELPPLPRSATSATADHQSPWTVSNHPDFETEARASASVRGGAFWIGAYRLVDLLGRGGFGCVFLAEREQPVRLQVAIKVIRQRESGPQAGVLGRFLVEREVLARMNHPGIAYVIDAGETETRFPYLVMEYVSGETLVCYCNARRMPLHKRLDLFVSICDAVQHAHDRGIIHRDLKPMNILARDVDGQAVAKVIDFGIAKAISKEALSQRVETVGAHSPGTLTYMSPEQAGLSPRDLDVRTDVFSLGIVLYELLVDVRPFDDGQLFCDGTFEALRSLRDRERPRASSRLLGLDEPKRHRIAEMRSIDAGELTLTLRQDLDWILAKALELDRKRRYGSPSELAADIQRYLRGQPVLARPPSLGYRTQKFVRRNRLAVAASAALTAAIASGTAVAGWQWRNAVGERNATDELLQFVNVAVIGDSLDDPTPRFSVSESALEEARQRFQTRLGSRPAIARRLSSTFAAAFLAAGKPRRTIELLMPEWKLAGPDISPQTARSLATALMRERRAKDAIDILTPVIDRETRRLGIHARDDQSLATVRDAYAASLKWNSNYEAAAREWRRVLEVRRRGNENDRKLALVVEYDLLLNRQRQIDAATNTIDKHAEYQAMLAEMDQLASRMQNAFYDESDHRPVGEDEHTLSCRIERIGFQERLGERSRAIDAMEALLPTLDEALGPHHWRAAEARARLGTWLVREQRYAEGEAALRRSLRGLKSVYGDASIDVLRTATWLSKALAGQDRHEEERAVFREAFDAARKSDASIDVLKQAATWRENNLTQRGDAEAAVWQAEIQALEKDSGRR